MFILSLIICFSKVIQEKQFLLYLKMLHRLLFRTIVIGLLLFLILAPHPGFTQEHFYEIIHGGERIGILSVKCQKSGNSVTYSISSDAKTRFIIDINVNVLIEEIFESGQMERSTLIRKINGKTKINNDACKIPGGYALKKKGRTCNVLTTVINCSLGAMYFNEPQNQHLVYSELYQQLIPVREAGTNRYLVEFPDQNKSYYTYSNGLCTEVEAHTDWATLFFKLLDDNSVNREYTKN